MIKMRLPKPLGRTPLNSAPRKNEAGAVNIIPKPIMPPCSLPSVTAKINAMATRTAIAANMPHADHAVFGRNSRP